MPALVPFDYASLPSDLASEARDVAIRIRERNRRGVEAIVETGRDLVTMKDRLGHGHFLKWIEAEFAMTRQTAHNYMTAATRLGSKCQTVGHLPPTILYQLAAESTPEPVREAVVSRIEAGEALAPASITAMVREARQAEREAERRGRKTPEEIQRDKRAADRRQRAHEAEMADMAERQRVRDAAFARAAELAILHMGDGLDEFIDVLRTAGCGPLAHLIAEARPVRPFTVVEGFAA